MAATVNEDYTYDAFADDGGSPESGVKVYAWDDQVSPAVVINATTDGTGAITQQQLRAAVHSVTGAVTSTTDRNPFKIRALKYGFTFIEISKSIASASSDTFFLSTNSQITQSNKATVEGYTGITVNHGSDLITITNSKSIEEVYDYLQSECVDTPQYDYLEIITTLDGTNYTCAYDITVDGASAALTGAGQFLDLGSNTFTLANGGSTTMTVTDVNGTSVTTAVTVRDLNTKVALEDARVYVVADTGGPLTQGTVIINADTNASGVASDTRTLTSNQPITGWVRRATDALGTLYKESSIVGTIDSTSGLNLTVQMIPDE